jgi:tRNA-dihydrouridine synthase B
MLKIGSLKLESNVLLAPLAGISDSSFRLICREFGVGFTFVEMINARALSYKGKKTKKMLRIDPHDKPIGIQLLGAELPYLIQALEVIESFYDFDLLDFNVACPVRKVCRRGEGAALMKEPEKLEKILKGLIQRWHKPVTVKIRSGWDQDSKNAVQIGKVAEQSGVHAIFIHGRDKNQLYAGSVDYKIIADVKKNVRVPIIASGDIFCAQSAQKMFDKTGCDGILVARGALGNPWIFREIDEFLKHKRTLPAPPVSEVIKTLLKHLELSVAEHGEKNGVALMRKFVGWYFKGRPYVRPLRQKVNTVKTKKEFVALIETIPALANQREMC